MKKALLSVLVFLSMATISITQPYLTIGNNNTSIDLTNSNLNTLTAVGFYKGYNMANAPDAGWWYITVEAHDNTGGNDDGWAKQTATSYGASNSYPTGTTFIRTHAGLGGWTAWSSLIQTASNGKVGIGTTAPDQKLTVKGGGIGFDNNSQDKMLYSPVDGVLEWMTHNSAGEHAFAISHQGSQRIYLNTAGNSYLNGGNIGVGTTTPSQKLSINGTALARKMKVSDSPADWPDYVFDSSYQLTPLHQVEKYILQNKHLPEIPSAAAVKKDGLDLGDNQALLLKKIEELTLYILQQHKELQSIKEDMKDLKRRAK